MSSLSHADPPSSVGYALKVWTLPETAETRLNSTPGVSGARRHSPSPGTRKGRPDAQERRRVSGPSRRAASAFPRRLMRHFDAVEVPGACLQVHGEGCAGALGEHTALLKPVWPV